MVIKYNFIISFQRALSYTKAAFGSLAEWFKAPDLGSGIFGCVSSNLTALIFFPYTAVLQSARSVFCMVVGTPRLLPSRKTDIVPCTIEVLLSKPYSQA